MSYRQTRGSFTRAILATGLLTGLLGGAGAAHGATAARSSAFDYDPVSGLINKEIVEQGDPNLCVVTTYVRDDFGNKTSTTTRNCNGSGGSSPGNNSEAAAPSGLPVFAPRTTTAVYTDPRFASPITNAAGQTETRSYSAAFGVVTSLVGPNQLATNWAYDEFGRKTIEQRADGTGTTWSYRLCTTMPGGTESCPTIAGISSGFGR